MKPIFSKPEISEIKAQTRQAFGKEFCREHRVEFYQNNAVGIIILNGYVSMKITKAENGSKWLALDLKFSQVNLLRLAHYIKAGFEWGI